MASIPPIVITREEAEEGARNQLHSLSVMVEAAADKDLVEISLAAKETMTDRGFSHFQLTLRRLSRDRSQGE